MRGGIAVTVFIALVLATAAPAQAAQRVYVSDSGNGDVAVAPINEETGALGAALTPVATTGNNNEAIAFTPNGSQLFTGDGTGISRFAVDAGTGALTGPTATATTSGYGVVVTPNSSFIYQAGGGDIYAFALNADGTIGAPVPGSPFTPASYPDGLAVTPDGKYLYSANNNDSTVGAFSIAANGALTELTGSPYAVSGAPYAISLTPDGKRLYVPSRNVAPNRVYAYDIGSSGALTPVVGSPFNQNAGVANSFGSTVTPDGKYLFTANFNSADVSGFSIAASGALTELAGSPYSLPGTSPAALTTDADGSHLYVEDNNSGNVYAFSLGANGVPSALAGSPFSVGATGDFQSIVLNPDQPPVAKVTSKVSGKSASFNATGSTDDGAITRYLWDYGDGKTQDTTSAKPSHKYSKNGIYTATVQVFDENGCSTTYVAAGQTPFCNGGPGAVASTTVKISNSDGKKPELKVDVKKKQKLGKPIKVKVESATGVRVTAATTQAKLKGASEKKVTYKGATTNIGKNGKGKLTLKIKRREAKISKGAESGKVKVKLTAANNAGTSKKTLKIKLK